MLNWARPRDLSHYETFEHYHATFYQHVEALSVTPFAPRALDRGLTGVLASLMRLDGPEWNPNHGAALVEPADPRAQRARDAICARADDQIGPRAAEELADRVTKRLEAWKNEADKGQRTLVYGRRGRGEPTSRCCRCRAPRPGTSGRCRRRCATSRTPCAGAAVEGIAPDDAWEAPERSAPVPRPQDGPA